MRFRVTRGRRCEQIPALGADEVPEVKISAHWVSRSGSMPRSSAEVGSAASSSAG